MLRAADFRLISVQASLFLLDPKSFSQSLFLAHILGRFATRYDGPVQALPLQDDIPAEIPRVILQSHDGQWKLQAALNRIDSFWFSNNDSTHDISIANQCVEVLQFYVQNLSNIQVVRLGFVIGRISSPENPTKELIERFCNEESKNSPFNRSESFEIHNHKKYNLRNTRFAINSWVRCRAGMATSPFSKKAVLIEQDINTVADNIQNLFSLEDITNFYMECQIEFDEILHIYFP
jgi:hypothetical protein